MRVGFGVEGVSGPSVLRGPILGWEVPEGNGQRKEDNVLSRMKSH